MGAGTRFRCGDCSFKTDYLLLDVGMDSSGADIGDCENHLSMYVEDERIKQELFAVEAEPDAKLKGFRYDIYCCAECNNLEVHMYFKIVSARTTYKPIYKCKICKNPLLRVEHNSLPGGRVYFKDADEPTVLSLEALMAESENTPAFLSYPPWRPGKCPQCGGERLLENLEDFLLWD